MIQNVTPTGPSTGPQGPQGPQPSAPSPSSGGGYSQEVMSAWGKMFGGMASPQELKMAIDMAIKQAIDEMKKEQQRALEAIKKMRKDSDDQQ